MHQGAGENMHCASYAVPATVQLTKLCQILASRSLQAVLQFLQSHQRHYLGDHPSAWLQGARFVSLDHHLTLLRTTFWLPKTSNKQIILTTRLVLNPNL